jgi:hypothetical protein
MHILGTQWLSIRLIDRKTKTTPVFKCKNKAVTQHASVALGGRGDIAPTHSRPRH